MGTVARIVGLFVSRHLLFLLVVAAALIFAGSLYATIADVRAANSRADSLAAELVAERARADGWQVTFAETTENLLDDLANSDAQVRRLRDDLDAIRSQTLSRTGIVATAEGDTATAASVATPDSLTGYVEDGPLTARLSCYPVRRELGIMWNVVVSADLLHVISPDDRLMVFARTQDERVELEVPVFEYQMPEAKQDGLSAPLWTIPIALIGGAIGWEVIR